MWKKIEDSNYSVSINGEVRNDKFDRILKQSKDTSGYYQVDLSKNGKRKKQLVHRLVSLAFIPLVPGCEFVSYIIER